MAKQIRRHPPISKVMQDLTGVKIQDFDNDQYDNLVKNTYIEPSNIEFISDLSQVIQLQQKPQGLQLVKVHLNGDTINSSSYTSLLEIPAGKTYDIQAICVIGSTSSCDIAYALRSDYGSGELDYLLKIQSFDGTDGVNVDFTTSGDFLISGLPDKSTYLRCKRNSGTGSVSGHNIFYREVN